MGRVQVLLPSELSLTLSRGGSKFGGNPKWLYDGGNLVSKSVALKKPVIMVSLKYGSVDS